MPAQYKAKSKDHTSAACLGLIIVRNIVYFPVFDYVYFHLFFPPNPSFFLGFCRPRLILLNRHTTRSFLLPFSLFITFCGFTVFVTLFWWGFVHIYVYIILGFFVLWVKIYIYIFFFLIINCLFIFVIGLMFFLLMGLLIIYNIYYYLLFLDLNFLKLID